MIINPEKLKKLEVLLNPAVEEAILTILDDLYSQHSPVLSNFQASEAELRVFQGQLSIINDLKDYKQRILDARKHGSTNTINTF